MSNNRVLHVPLITQTLCKHWSDLDLCNRDWQCLEAVRIHKAHWSRCQMEHFMLFDCRCSMGLYCRRAIENNAMLDSVRATEHLLVSSWLVDGFTANLGHSDFKRKLIISIRQQLWSSPIGRLRCAPVSFHDAVPIYWLVSQQFRLRNSTACTTSLCYEKHSTHP